MASCYLIGQPPKFHSKWSRGAFGGRPIEPLGMLDPESRFFDPCGLADGKWRRKFSGIAGWERDGVLSPPESIPSPPCERRFTRSMERSSLLAIRPSTRAMGTAHEGRSCGERGCSSKV